MIGYKNALADFLLTLDIVLSVMPPGIVTIETTEDALSVGITADLVALTARVDVIEPAYLIAKEMPVAPNRIYSSKRFTTMCGGVLGKHGHNCVISSTPWISPLALVVG